MRHILIATIAIMFCLAGCGSADKNAPTNQWTEFSSPQGKFTVLMPGVPQASQETIDTVIGPLVQHSFKLRSNKSVYIISYVDYPGKLRVSPAKFLEETWKAGWGNLGSRLLYKRSGSSEGDATLEFQYKGESGKAIATSRYYLAGQRLYDIAVITPTAQSSGDAEKFMTSFKLTQ